MSYPHLPTDCAAFHDLVRDLDGETPWIVTLCGSTRFRDEFTAVNRDLTKQGVMVLAPGVFVHDGDVTTDEEKARLDVLHLQKIQLAHEVFIVNPGGYIGESTANEIRYARKLGRPIRYLEDVPATV